MTVETFGSNFHTTLGVYVGPIPLGCNDDAVTLQSASLVIPVETGGTYCI